MRFSALLFGLVTILISPLANAQDFPNRAIRLIEPVEPGAAIDKLLFLIGNGMQAEWGQPGVVDFRAGAGGIIGTDFVAKSKPDGYTLLIANSGPVGILPNLMAKLPYDAEKDFVPVAPLISNPLVLVVNSSLQIKTVPDLIDYAKKNPGKLAFLTNGVGQAAHLTLELLKKMTGIDVKIVPYKGTAPALTALLGGAVDAGFFVAPAVMSLNDPRVLLLATTTAERTPYIEGLPTMKEMGYPVYAESWLGILAPANTPDPVVAKLEAGIQKIMETKEAQDAIKSLQVTRMKGTGKDFGVFLSQERKKWGDVIKSANITLE